MRAGIHPALGQFNKCSVICPGHGRVLDLANASCNGFATEAGHNSPNWVVIKIFINQSSLRIIVVVLYRSL